MTEKSRTEHEIPERYRSKTTVQALGHLAEECGEVLAATGKTLRFGLDCFNPELPPDKRETNRLWLLRELNDLERAIRVVRKRIEVDDE